MKLKKYEAMPPAAKKMIEEAGEEIAIGKIYISYKYSRYEIVKIREIEYVKKTQHHEAYVMIYYDRATTWDCTKWKSYGDSKLKQFVEEYVLLKKPIAEYLAEVKEIFEGKKDIELYRDRSSDALSSETALISKNSKEGLIAIQGHLEERKKGVEVLARVMGWEMERRKAELDAYKEKLYGIVAEFEKKITKIMRVITTIELYLGIDEELFQIQDGPRASSTTPLSFRQQVLYMDEEIGHWKDGGLDYKDISWFDEWLIKNDNFKKLCPEEKCVVVFRPRRFSKRYSDDYIENIIKNVPNLDNTYILIRNGECLFRIFTEKIVILPRLFPKRKELTELLKKIEEETWESQKEEKKDKIEDLTYQYRKRAFILQGLIDRSEVFHPMDQKISIFNMDATPELINFIYDDEDALPSGRLSFDKWWKSINSQIAPGSRILLTGHYDYYKYGSRRDFSERFYLAANSDDGLKNVPDLPKEGVYEVEDFRKSYTRDYRLSEYNEQIEKLTKEGTKHTPLGIKKGKVWRKPDEKTGSNKIYHIRYYSEEVHYTIMYMPDAKATSGWDYWDQHERKARTRFRIYNDDDFVINYDQIDLADIDFYLTSRVDRPNYLEMMPILEKIKAHRLKELEGEKEFMKFVVARNKDKVKLNEEALRKMVVDSVIWWKYKNKWKRPIVKDDTLALRMIEKRILSPNYKPFQQ